MVLVGLVLLVCLIFGLLFVWLVCWVFVRFGFVCGFILIVNFLSVICHIDPSVYWVHCFSLWLLAVPRNQQPYIYVFFLYLVPLYIALFSISLPLEEEVVNKWQKNSKCVVLLSLMNFHQILSFSCI